MAKRLRAIIKECREVLEKEVLTHIASIQLSRLSEADLDAHVQDTALAVFIELATVRCIEVRDGTATSAFSFNPDWDILRRALSRKRHSLQAQIPVPLQWADLSAVTLSDTAVATLIRHLVESISSEDWGADHILGWIYESFQADTADQKQHGRFYTPETVTRSIVEQALELWEPELTPQPSLLQREGAQVNLSHAPSPKRRGEDWLPLSLQERGPGGKFFPTILDLGCGCGAFTLQVFDLLVQRYHAQGHMAGTCASDILAHHLFLLDNDPWACQIAALSLYLKAIRLDPACRIERLNIVCTDALQRWEAAENSEYSDIRKIFTSKYDLVIGNPPYRVVNQLRAPQELLRLYKTYRSAAYKINTFPLFVERGIGFLKPHGVLAMVVPNTMLTQVYFEPLRRYILNSCKIARILDTKRVFDSAFVENCILFLEREEPAVGHADHQVECFTGHSAPNRILQRHFECAPFLMFQVHCDEFLHDLLEHIAHDAPTLGDICESHDGVNPGNAKNKLIVPDAIDETCKKVLNGKNIRRYQLRWGGLYVRYDRSLLAKGDNVRWGHRAALDSAKILTRQTADRIIGTFDDGRYYVTNSIHTSVLRAEHADVLLKYVLAALNSKLLSWYYRKLFPEVGQVFSQVKLVNLRQLPITLIPLERQQEIVAVVEELLEDAPCMDLFANSAACAVPWAKQAIDQRERRACRARELDDTLDTLMYAAYGLSSGQIRQVEEESGARITHFPRIEVEALGRELSYEAFCTRYCRERRSIFDIAAEYQVHPTSISAFRRQHDIYQEEEFHRR